ncbi:hypothetical protein Kfla_0821 [Kribbella flavida DSM 17836]|uniref:Uncharacterized protein n=1 Tax=Kribbella flavida (strain DSM 17836 / JCM 10339 / NBRC 14399) TaxID=479435 RepID=D2PYT8_KRIFD|nr:hypothetical protein [Kribbella flavida]ADB29934.1 hypothetical protein Kfla_0821 [Kribbella flavida DSM 17836]
MSEATTTNTLALRTRRLSALARAKRDNEGETQAQGQVATALYKLNGLLIELDSSLKTRRALVRAGVTLPPLDGLSKPATALRDHFKNVGRPAAQFLTARSKDVAKLRDTMTGSHKQAWRQWAESQIDALDEASLPPFGTHANAVRERIQSLRRYAAESPTLAVISSFKVTLDAARDNLAAIAEGLDPENLEARIVAGGMTLADLSDDDLVELRADSALAARIQLSIR